MHGWLVCATGPACRTDLAIRRRWIRRVRSGRDAECDQLFEGEAIVVLDGGQEGGKGSRLKFDDEEIQ